MGLTLTRLCSCVPCGWETHFWGCFFFFFFFLWFGSGFRIRTSLRVPWEKFVVDTNLLCANSPAWWYRARHCTLPSQPLWNHSTKTKHPSQLFKSFLPYFNDHNRGKPWLRCLATFKKVHFYYCSCVMWQNSALLLLCKDDSTHLPPIMTHCLK